MAESTDWLLIDTAAGIHDSVIKLLMASQEVVLITTPEPTSLVDAYAMVKVVHLRDPKKPFWLMVNNAQGQAEAEETLEQLQAAITRFLGRELNVLGMIPADRYVLQAVREQHSFAELYPQSPAALALERMALLLKQKVPLQRDGFAAFWKSLSNENS